MKQPEHSARSHSLLAPSKAKTWANCTMSVQYCEDNKDRLKPDVASIYAQEGTKAHEVADCIMQGKRAPAWATKEMLDHAQQYKRFCASLHPEGIIDPEGVEMEVPLFYRPEDNGHVDYCLDLLASHNTIHVVDYKYGAGVYVAAVKNEQMASYLVSKVEAGDVKPKADTMCKMHIYQPRNKDAQEHGKTSTWSVRWDELMAWAEPKIGVPAELIQRKVTHLLKFAPSDDACRWCPASTFCTARTAWLLQGDVSDVFEEVDVTGVAPSRSPEGMPEASIANIIKIAPAIRRWLDDCEEYAMLRARAGRPVKGTKVVAGKGSREWADPRKAELVMMLAGVNAYKPTIKSPYQAITELEETGADPRLVLALTNLVLKRPGGPKITTADDPRPPLVDVAVEFSDVADEP